MSDQLTKDIIDEIVILHGKLFHNDFLKKAMYTNKETIIQFQNISDECFCNIMEEIYGGKEIEVEDEEGNITKEIEHADIFYKNEIDGKYGYFIHDNCCFMNSPGGDGTITADDVTDIFYLFNKIYSELYNGTIVLFKNQIDFGAYSLIHDPEYSFKPNLFQKMKGVKAELGLLDQLKVKYKRRDSNIVFDYNGLQVLM